MVHPARSLLPHQQLSGEFAALKKLLRSSGKKQKPNDRKHGKKAAAILRQCQAEGNIDGGGPVYHYRNS